jgi:ABC-type proline/glycine betaine transport system permease subunit
MEKEPGGSSDSAGPHGFAIRRPWEVAPIRLGGGVTCGRLSPVPRPGRPSGSTAGALVRRVILPGALPGFLVGLRFALVGSWVIDVVTEEINAQSGLGYLINQAQTTDRTDIMFLCLAIYAILGLLADALVRFLERRLLAWRNGFQGA